MVFRIRHIWLGLAFLFAAFLAGCSSSAGGATTDPGEPMIPEPTPIPAPEVPPRIPTGGSATYNGRISLDFRANAGGDVTLVGALSLAVDFGGTATQLSGEASSFQALSGGAYTGSVFFTRGVIDRGAATGEPDFAGAISGALRGDVTSYVLFGTFYGGFAGSGVQALRGTVSGTAREGGVDTVLTGAFSGGEGRRSL